LSGTLSSSRELNPTPYLSTEFKNNKQLIFNSDKKMSVKDYPGAAILVLEKGWFEHAQTHPPPPL